MRCCATGVDPTSTGVTSAAWTSNIGITVTPPPLVAPSIPLANGGVTSAGPGQWSMTQGEDVELSTSAKNPNDLKETVYLVVDINNEHVKKIAAVPAGPAAFDDFVQGLGQFQLTPGNYVVRFEAVDSFGRTAVGASVDLQVLPPVDYWFWVEKASFDSYTGDYEDEYDGYWFNGGTNQAAAQNTMTYMQNVSVVSNESSGVAWTGYLRASSSMPQEDMSGDDPNDS